MRPCCVSWQGARTSSQMVVKETWKKNKDQNIGEIQPAKEGMLMVRKACIERRQKRGKVLLSENSNLHSCRAVS